MPASTKLRVPDRYAPSLAKFVLLSPQEIAALLKAIREDKPSLDIPGLIDAIAGRLDMERARVDEIVNLLISLQGARESLGLPVNEFVAEIRSSLEASNREELQDLTPDWEKFQEEISAALAEDTALALSAKALDVMTDHAKRYCTVRILTDLRPVFRSEVDGEEPMFVIVHTLKVVYHETGKHAELFVALDRSDLEQLQGAVERALKKEESLKSLALSKGMRTLEVAP
jgi:hypothetical protein